VLRRTQQIDSGALRGRGCESAAMGMLSPTAFRDAVGNPRVPSDVDAGLPAMLDIEGVDNLRQALRRLRDLG